VPFTEPDSSRRLPAQFGDRVRIRRAAETEAAGIAGRTGQVFGTTRPSFSGVAVLGSPAEDVALGVAIDNSGRQIWLEPAFVEFVGHQEGLTVTLDGVPKTWARTESGFWQQLPPRPPAPGWSARLKGLLRRLTGR
jgi:hypothetical protein